MDLLDTARHFAADARLDLWLPVALAASSSHGEIDIPARRTDRRPAPIEDVGTTC